MQPQTIVAGALSGQKFLLRYLPAALILLTALIYIKALFNGFIINWDDDTYLLQDPLIRDFSLRGIGNIFSSFSNANYHPLTTLVYMTEFKLFGLNPLPYHLLSVLLHLLNTWLVYLFAKKLSGRAVPALIVLALFALHPMHVESVAWISELKDVLFTLFYLLALLAYLRYADSGQRPKYLIIAFLWFILSLLSKPAAITLPLIFIVIDVYKTRKVGLRSLAGKLPFLLLSVLFGLLAIFSQSAKGAIVDLSLHHGIVDRFFFVTYAVAFYMVKFIVPFGLCAMHYFPPAGHGLPWEYYASLPFVLALLVPMFLRHRFRKAWIFAFLFYLVSVSVMLQVVHVGEAIVAERYTYVPYIGLSFFAGMLIDGIGVKKMRTAFLLVFAAFVAMFSYVTWSRIGDWKDGASLFDDVIAKNPGYPHGYYFRGKFRHGAGDTYGAMKDYNRILGEYPSYVPALIERSSISNDLGDFEGAINDLNAAIRIDSSIAVAFNNRGIAYQSSGRMQQARRDYDRAISLDPAFARAYVNRGVVKLDDGDFKGALADYNRALQLDPGLAEAYSNRGMVLHELKDDRAALRDYDAAIRLKPSNAFTFNNRGKSRFTLGDHEGAMEDFNTSLAMNSRNAYAFLNRGELNLYLKKYDDAMKDLNTCIGINASLAEAYYLRGQICDLKGDKTSAVADWKKASELGSREASILLNSVCP